jgi:stage II sporulation protein D
LDIGYIQERIRDGGYKVDIVSIEVLKRDGSGRVLDIVLKGRDGDVKLSGNRFRLLIGPNKIKSTNFEIHARSRYITFYGKGWGHGIGMCQWGAYGMARRDWNAEAILEYYYPDSSITRVEDEDIRF